MSNAGKAQTAAAAESANWRLLACHNFVSQDVFVTQDRDIAAMCAARDKLLIATSRMSVEVRDLNSKGLLLFAFPTTDQAVMIDYCEGANFVLSLEKTMTRSVDVFHVRAYFNWWVEPCNQVPKMREAGSEPESNDSAGGRRLEIVELPAKRHGLSCVACCRQAGTTLVAAGRTVSVFVLKTAYDKTKKQMYNDFERLMQLEIGFKPNSVHVCEDHVACCNNSEVLVFQIRQEAEAIKSLETAEATTTGSQKKKQVAMNIPESDIIPDDPNYVQLRFESDESTDGTQPQAGGQDSQKDLEDSDVIVLGPRVNPPDVCKVAVTVDPDTDLVSSLDVSAVVLLYRNFNRDSGPVMAFHWMPYYVNDSMAHPLTEAMSNAPKTASFVLHSGIFTKLRTLACLVSSGKRGYLYRLSDIPQLVSIYRYSKEAKSVAVDTFFLHALTIAGLETYTVPILYESKELIDARRTPSGKPTVMVGLRPFLGLKTLLMSDQHLVMASAAADDAVTSQEATEPSCTLYSLMKPSVDQFFFGSQGGCKHAQG
ncbi:hypothetical protein MTO96_019787 [Rhipicephalus appendiculatus]